MPRKPRGWRSDAKRSGNRNIHTIGDTRQPRLFVSNQRRRNLSAGNPHQKVSAKTVDGVVPPVSDKLEWKIREFRVLVAKQALHELARNVDVGIGSAGHGPSMPRPVSMPERVRTAARR